MRIALGVGGGIAAYKCADLVRLLTKRGYEVEAVMTRAAQEFITPLVLATLTARKPITELFSHVSPEATLTSAVEHIRVAQETDILLVAPATANLLAKFANGLADDFLSTFYLAFDGPVILAPAMNTKMWEHAATQHNLRALRARGHAFIEPGEGFLACGTVGPGRMAEPEEIAQAVDAALRTARKDLVGETALITAGPTQEAIDPVRYLSNRSSGKMGYALAHAALRRGARVTLISGPVHLPPPLGVDLVQVRSAQEMYDATLQRFPEVTIAIKCAAVADFRVAEVSPQKIKKTGQGRLLELVPTPDILAEMGRRKTKQVLVGFAAETGDLEREARRKLTEKNCDLVVGNLVGGSGTGFDGDENEAVVFTPGGSTPLGRASKEVIADRILDTILKFKGTLGVGLAS